MIRTTYRGRAIKVLAARGKPGHVKLVINGYTTNNAWQGDDAQALDWVRQIIDRIEDNGGPGMVAMLIPNQYTAAHWYEPGTVDVNPNGHATRPGSICMCSRCTTDEKSWFAPLPVDACRYCHQTPDNHRNDFDLMNPHSYKEPTDTQRAGRQAAIDDYNDTSYNEDDEAA
ncbi:hypothetical protein ACF1GW_38665 [Streptomyces achromogenes]|uniref:hypothetical protein n=1 Tax=Streptomyces achromogenes TaxID=67255 RepID=UPI0036FCC4A3